MALCSNLLLLLVLFKCSVCAKLTYNINEETGQNAYVGNIPQDDKLPPLSSSEKPREFKILSGSEYVKVDSGSGDMHTSANLDREQLCQNSRPKCVLDAEVVVFSSEPVRIIKVQLILKDLNDNTPSFPSDIINKEISESALVGSFIRLDSAVDFDLGVNSIQKYEISSSPPNRRDKNGISVPYFKLETIENIDGTIIPQLKLSKRLDREKTSSYEIILSAIDGGNPPLTGTATVVISVTDANDNQPSFRQDSYVVNVPENVQSGFFVMQLEATDLDSGPNARIAYSFSSIVSVEDRSKFILDEDTGVLTVSDVGLDFENKTIHHLTIKATDRGPDPASAYATVTIKVQDVNDEAPRIDVNFMDLTEKNGDGADGTSKQVSIQENTEVGTFIAFVTITDRDTGINGTVSCRLKESTSFEMTALDRDENRYLLKTKRELDREEKRFHSIEIEAWDFGQPSLTSSSTIIVELLDVNDNDPSFGKDIYELSVSENINPGAEVVVLQADDIDDGVNAEITYSAKPKLKGSVVPFVMNPKTGRVTFTQDDFVLDAENRSEPFLLTVIATDNGVPKRNTSTTLEILIADENDNPPRFKERSYVFRIKEDENMGKYLGQVAAVDRDVDKSTNGKITYSFLGDVTAFTIKAETGQIYFHGVPEDLDREARKSLPYELIVIAADHGNTPLTDRCTVEIYLIDVNDNSPKVISPNVTRDVSYLYIRPKITKTDARYVLPQATDDDDDDDEILEGIEDIENSTANPFPMIKIKKVYKPTLKDALKIGTSTSTKTRSPNSLPVFITKIKAKDPDGGENGRVRFTMAEGNTKDYFRVDMHTGNVTLRIKDEKSLRDMKRGCHVIKVNVNDLGKPSLQSPAWVNIYVTDANPGTINKTDALRSCKNNPFYPTILVPPDHSVAAAGLSLYLIIGIGVGAFVFLVLIVIVIIWIKFKCRCCDKKSRTYNCKNAADPYNDAGYSQGSSINGKRQKGPLRHVVPNGTVDSRSSFYSEWTASQMQMAQQGKGDMMMQEVYSEGSVRSQNSARDSGKGDSMPSDVYHTTVAGSAAYRPSFANQVYSRNIPQYGQPHNQPSHVYLPPQDGPTGTDDESRQNNHHYPVNPQMVFTSKCTNECRLQGHGDDCWMPDSLQRPPSRMRSFKEIDEFDGDSGNYQKRSMTPNSYSRHVEQMRYVNNPSNTPYYYDPGSKFDNLPQRGLMPGYRDDTGGSDTGSPAHSQLAASNVSRQPSTNAGYRRPAYSSQGHIPQVSYAQSPVPFNAASPTPYGGQSRGKAYVNLQGVVYDPNGGISEEIHSNLSSTSSGNQHPNYQNSQGYPQQYYSQEQSYPDAYQSGYPGYGSQGIATHYEDHPPAYNGDPSYEDNFAASNLLLSPADSDPTDYKQRLERQIRQQNQQPAYNYGNTPESDARRLLANEPSSTEHPEDDLSADKLSTIREEIDADEVVAGIEGLLL